MPTDLVTGNPYLPQYTNGPVSGMPWGASASNGTRAIWYGSGSGNGSPSASGTDPWSWLGVPNPFGGGAGGGRSDTGADWGVGIDWSHGGGGGGSSLPIKPVTPIVRRESSDPLVAQSRARTFGTAMNQVNRSLGNYLQHGGGTAGERAARSSIASMAGTGVANEAADAVAQQEIDRLFAIDKANQDARLAEELGLINQQTALGTAGIGANASMYGQNLNAQVDMGQTWAQILQALFGGLFNTPGPSGLGPYSPGIG